MKDRLDILRAELKKFESLDDESDRMLRAFIRPYAADALHYLQAERHHQEVMKQLALIFNELSR